VMGRLFGGLVETLPTVARRTLAVNLGLAIRRVIRTQEQLLTGDGGATTVVEAPRPLFDTSLASGTPTYGPNEDSLFEEVWELDTAKFWALHHYTDRSLEEIAQLFDGKYRHGTIGEQLEVVRREFQKSGQEL